MKVTDEIKEKVISLYVSGETTRDSAKACGISTGSAFKVLKAAGVMRTNGDAHRGFKKSPEECKRIGDMRRGTHHTEEAKRKMSEAHKIHHAGHRKLRDDGYIKVYFPDHPDATKDGYVAEHRLVMERAVGRRLEKNEVVHHINHIRTDNRIENLKLMTFSEHMSLHMRERHAERRNKKSINAS